MSRIAYFAPLMLVILSNTLYHLLSKHASSQLHPFAALAGTYGMALLGSLALLFLTKRGEALAELARLRPENLLMGLVIIGVEGGYLLLYRQGWELSRASLVANLCIAVILLAAGVLWLHESLSPAKLAGLLCCAAGLLLVNLG